MKDDSVRREAAILGRYLISETPHKDALTLYQKALAANPGQADKRDEQLLAFIHRHPRSLSLIDAGLSLVHPDSEVRRRIHLMFSILESVPAHCRHFMSVDRPPAYLFVLLYVGITGALKTLAGTVLVRAIAR